MRRSRGRVFWPLPRLTFFVAAKPYNIPAGPRAAGGGVTVTVVYIDSLFLLNLIVDYLLLLGAARLAGEPLRRLRFLAGGPGSFGVSWPFWPWPVPLGAVCWP